MYKRNIYSLTYIQMYTYTIQTYTYTHLHIHTHSYIDEDVSMGREKEVRKDILKYVHMKIYISLHRKISQNMRHTPNVHKKSI